MMNNKEDWPISSLELADKTRINRKTMRMTCCGQQQKSDEVLSLLEPVAMDCSTRRSTDKRMGGLDRK